MRQNTQVEVICGHCSKPFKTHAYRIANGTGKYCQQSCYLVARWREKGKCKQCGKKCDNRFCSTRCNRDYWNQHSHEAHKRPRNWERKLELIKQLGGKCVTCGYDDYRALDIDHIDPSKKVKPKNGQYAWTRRFKDWAANEGNLRLLCANCHRLHTWYQRGFGPRS